MTKRLATDITLNLSGNLAQKANKYSREMTSLGTRTKAAMGMITSSARAASRGIDSFGNRMVISAGLISVAFERSFIKTAAQFEKYKVMLSELQGSEEAGNQAMGWIEDFTMNTPFAINEVTESFLKLRTYGLDPMDGTMQSIADQAAKMGGNAESVNGIATALGQAWSKGKLQGEEIVQLLERGVPVYDYLIQASKELGHKGGLGYTVEELQKMGEQGELTKQTIKDLIRVMGEDSKGAAKRQMDTWDGMISNLGDWWTFIKRDSMDGGAFDALKDSLKSILDDLDEMKKSGEYDDLVKSLGDSLSETFTSAHKAIKSFTEGLKEARKAGEPLFPMLSGIKDAADSIAELAGGYGNLAKAAASIYAINKAIRIGSPLLNVGASAVRGGATVAGKVLRNSKAKRIANGLAGVGATPVFVTNMPGSGFSGNGGSAAGGRRNPKRTPRVPKKAGLIPRALMSANVMGDLAGPAMRTMGRFAGPVGVMMALSDIKPYDPKNPMFQPIDYSLLDLENKTEEGKKKQQKLNLNKGLMGYNKPITPQVQEAMDKYTQSFKSNSSSSWEMAGQAPRGNVTLDVNVHDDRITVKQRLVSPGLTVNADPDTGIN